MNRYLYAAAAAAALLLPGAPRAQQPDDAAYTARIRALTTMPCFDTDLTDHLPASGLPTPMKVLGYIPGDSEHLTYSADVYRYYRALAAATPRVRIFEAPEKSEEGRTQILVVISDAANLSNLDGLKAINAKIADQRGESAAEVAGAENGAKLFYWISGSIHSPETGSVEMLMELAYRLAADESSQMQAIRQNCVVMITPVLEVDGHDRMVDLANYHTAHPKEAIPPLVYWGHYVAHDNNRDALGMGLALSRNQMRTFLEYHPEVLHDLHESVPFLYISTGTGPYNSWLDPLVIDEWHEMAWHEIQEMTQRGVPGVWTHNYYDGWAPNYMFYVANGHNAIGRFYETFGNSIPQTMDDDVGSASTREWDRPAPPFPWVKWSLRNNVNLQESGLLIGLRYMAARRAEYVHNFAVKSHRSLEKARNEGPAAYILPANQPRPRLEADMLNLLRAQGIEVQQLTAATSLPAGTGKAKTTRRFEAGSYVVRMDQPYSRMADMLLDTQYYNVNDPPPYDDTGWTMGPLREVETVRLTDAAVLSAPMKLMAADASVAGGVTGASAPACWLVDATGEPGMMPLRYRLKGVRVWAAEAAFTSGGQHYRAGTFIVPAAGNPSETEARLRDACGPLGFTAAGAAAMPSVARHEIGTPRIALLHTWDDTQDEGWFRMEFDKLAVPYTYISDHVVRDTPDLRSRFDVIVFPPAGGAALGIVQGMPAGPPLPWTAPVLPNAGTSPDQAADIRGGMGLGGVVNLQRFVQSGGLLITAGSADSVATEFGLAPNISVTQAQGLQTAGSVFNAEFEDRGSPISYGYDETMGVYFRRSPMLSVATFGRGRGFGGRGGSSRASGRGGPGDRDIIQGMPQPPEKPTEPPLAPGEERVSEAERVFMGPYLTPPTTHPRVVLRFAKDASKLLVSGMLAGGEQLAGKPAIVDAPSGRGHVVLFAINPMWRHETQGSFALLFNAALNWDHLDVGRPAPAPATRAPAKPAP